MNIDTTWVVALPGRAIEDLTSMEKHCLLQRGKKVGGYSAIAMSPIPTTPRELSFFLDELEKHRCSTILIDARAVVREEFFGPLLINDIRILRFNNKLEILSSFEEGALPCDGKTATFVFCNNDMDAILFPGLGTLAS